MIWLSPFFLIYFSIISAVLGTVMGSFLCCAAYRYVNGESVLKGRSKCDICGHVLGAAELIPIVSFAVQRGKCRHCGGKISAECVIAEILLSAVYVLCLLRFDVSISLAEAIIFCSLLFVIGFIDLKSFEIPDGLLIAAVMVWLIFLPLTGSGLEGLKNGLIGGFGIAVPLLLIVIAFEKVKKKEAMGGGDIKLIFVTGLYLGIGGNFLCLMVSCFLGVLLAMVLGKKTDMAIPFGPAIGAGAVLALLYGQGVINWYLGLF